MKAYKAILPIVGLVIVALALFGLGLLAPAQPTMADTVPTPVNVQHPGSPYVMAPFFQAAAHAGDTNSNALQLPTYKVLDVQYVIDQDDAATNTLTLTLQWSNDNTNWSDGPAIVANNSADADSMVQVVNMGRYARINNNVANTNTVTVTVIGLAH